MTRSPVYDSNGYLAEPARAPAQWAGVCGHERPGAMMALGGLPPGFLIVQNFLNAATCDRIVQECSALKGECHTVFDASASAGAPVTRSDARTSEFIDSRALSTDVAEIVACAYRDIIAPHYRAELDWIELPEILRYGPGGEYKPHADAENWHGAQRGWVREMDRDLSLLIYVNNAFTGGELYFPNFQMALPPQRGMLVCFPSDARYVHTARPVKTGLRIAIVSWAAAKGSARVNAAPPTAAIRI